MNRFSALCLAAILAAPAAFPSRSASAAERIRSVGLALPSRREERWQRDLAVIAEEARNREIDLRYRVAQNDQEEQDRQIGELLAEGVDVLVIAAHDTTAVVPTLRRLRTEGVKVVVYDRLVNDCEYDLYVGFDSLMVGELQGAWIAARVPRGRYMVMSGASTDANAALYRAGVDSVLRPLIERGDIEIVADGEVTDWDPAVAERMVLEAIDREGGRIDAIVAPNDGTAGGAIRALAARGLAGRIPVTGHDGEPGAAQRILDGTQGMTVLKDTRTLGREGLRMAGRLAANLPMLGEVPGLRLMQNGQTRVPTLLIHPRLVDAGNLQEVLFDSGYLDRESVAREAMREE